MDKMHIRSHSAAPNYWWPHPDWLFWQLTSRLLFWTNASDGGSQGHPEPYDLHDSSQGTKSVALFKTQDLKKIGFWWTSVYYHKVSFNCEGLLWAHMTFVMEDFFVVSRVICMTSLLTCVLSRLVLTLSLSFRKEEFTLSFCLLKTSDRTLWRWAMLMSSRRNPENRLWTLIHEWVLLQGQRWNLRNSSHGVIHRNLVSVIMCGMYHSSHTMQRNDTNQCQLENRRLRKSFGQCRDLFQSFPWQ